MRAVIIKLPRPLLLAAAVIAALALFLAIRAAVTNSAALTALSPALLGQTVIIDPGHGGWDPGMKGAGGSVEAEVNLAISLKLAEYCREAGAIVLLTREKDEALADTKAEDMRRRVAIAEDADIFVSIHCNSYPGQQGAQVFYEKGNPSGKALAENIQGAIINELANTRRSALPHADSFLLKNIPGAAAICETGFLSDSGEEALLLDENYQWQMAWAIFKGMATAIPTK